MQFPRYDEKMPSLENEPFFRDFSEELLQEAARYVYHREYEPRQIIYFPDDPCDLVYWLRNGCVKVTRAGERNREMTFRLLYAGDILGEDVLSDAPRRDDYAEALTSSVLCLMRVEDYRRLVREEAEFAYAIGQCLCRRVKEVENTLADTVFLTVKSRVAGALARLHRQTGKDSLPVTHQDLANLVGATRETTTNMLHTLQAAGALQLANRQIHVIDPAILENHARLR